MTLPQAYTKAKTTEPNKQIQNSLTGLNHKPLVESTKLIPPFCASKRISMTWCASEAKSWQKFPCHFRNNRPPKKEANYHFYPEKETRKKPLCKEAQINKMKVEPEMKKQRKARN